MLPAPAPALNFLSLHLLDITNLCYNDNHETGNILNATSPSARNCALYGFQIDWFINTILSPRNSHFERVAVFLTFFAS
jgi:hypothetical protein